MSHTYMRCLLLTACLTLLTPPASQGARILCASQQFGSHLLMVHTVAEGLLDRGHEVYTVLSDKMPVPKGLREKGFQILRYHTPDSSAILASNDSSNQVIEDVMSGRSNLDKTSVRALGECVDMDNDAVLSTQISRLNFDMAIFDVFPPSTCMMFLALKHNLPFVIMPPSVDMEMMRTPVLPAFTPCLLLDHSDDMTFTERLVGTAMALTMMVPALSPFPALRDTSLVLKYSKDPEVTTWNDVARLTELFLVSRGPILEYALPLQPNIILIECLTCKPSIALEASIEAMVSNANGIIVVSFGSLIAEFPDHVTEKFLNAFAVRDEVIMWRYTGQLQSSLPPNVKVLKWLPQNDLLAHPKTKLFITHAGNNGQYESLFHGIPMLAFPLFAEQPHNAHRMVEHGFGMRMDIRSFTVEELGAKMAEVIDNPIYRQRTQKAGRILKASDMNARQRAAYWIEHVLEFGGQHLRSHALKMPWYSFYMLDILLFIELVVFVLIGLCCCIVRSLKRSRIQEFKQKKH